MTTPTVPGRSIVHLVLEPRRALIVLAVVACMCATAHSQPNENAPNEEERAALQSGLVTLREEIARAAAASPENVASLADIEVYAKAIDWVLRHPEEFYTPSSVTEAMEVLEAGLARARQYREGRAPWLERHRFGLGYRSAVDGSVQPYAIALPESYPAGKGPYRLDVVLHGRNGRLSEVSFLARTGRDAGKPADGDAVVLYVFGRTNNAYRWSGESDVFEALEATRSRFPLDERRIVLRGFSMGGAGAWHIGLHYPDRWAAVEAGAGFTETIRYARLPDLPDYQRRALPVYDALDCARNVLEVPFVGYGGEKDAQLQAAMNIHDALVAEGHVFERSGLDRRGPFLFLVGPGAGHRFLPQSKRLSEAFIELELAFVDRDHDHVRFVTPTLRYDRCRWVRIEALERHYDLAEVDARIDRTRRRVALSTRNISRLAIDVPSLAGATVDGGDVDIRSYEAPLHLAKTVAGRWRAASDAEAWSGGRRKRHALQGPIDDAFTAPFLCVRPSDEPWNAAVNDYAIAALELFAAEYEKWLRADPPVVIDRDVSRDDIASKHLILFGDPGSNGLIRRVLPDLPIDWSRDRLRFGARNVASGEYVPVLIFPNPLAPNRYVVINSGHTFHERHFRGTNALLFPRLGDWALLRVAGLRPGLEEEAVVAAGFFDEEWGWGD